MQSLKLYSLLLGVALTLFSCIDDSTPASPRDVKVALGFEYFTDGPINRVNYFVHSTNIFIYDAAGQLHKKVMAYGNELKNSKTIYLKPGEYTFVAWGNVGAETTIQNETNLEGALIAAEAFVKKEDPTSIDRLYFARKDVDVVPCDPAKDDAQQDEVLEFESAHIQLKVLVRGVEATGEELIVENLIPAKSFNNSYSGSELISFKPTQNLNTVVWPLTGQLYELNTFRFSRDNSVILNLIDPLTKVNLVDPISLKEILDSQNFSLESKQDITLFIEIMIDNSKVSVTIQAWNKIETTPSN